ncbi:MAG: efflux RND transporter periplasmic adaptor subunit [Pseudomonadota bacterium]
MTRTWLSSLFLAALLHCVGAGVAVADLARLAQTASCLIVESEVVELSSPAQGTIDQLMIAEGDSVRTGDLVAELEAGVERATLAAARARAESDVPDRARARELDAATTRLERQQSLRRRNVVADQVVEDAETEAALAALAAEEAAFNRTLADLEVNRAAAALERRRVVSPLDGVVTDIRRRAGEYVDAANPVAVIAAVNPLNVEVYLPLDAYPLVEPGMAATIAPQDPIGGQFSVTVDSRSPIVDAASGLFRIRLTLNNPGNQIPAGIRCTIAFD